MQAYRAALEAADLAASSINWLTLDQAERLLDLPDVKTKKGKRDCALLALLVGCGLRRQELAGLRTEEALGEEPEEAGAATDGRRMRSTWGRRKSS